jgi:hypothetical protein
MVLYLARMPVYKVRKLAHIHPRFSNTMTLNYDFSVAASAGVVYDWGEQRSIKNWRYSYNIFSTDFRTRSTFHIMNSAGISLRMGS